MLIKELYDHYGSWSKLMRTLELGSSTYQGWVRKGFIPYTTQLYIEKKTGGLFMASEEHSKSSGARF